MLNGAGCRSPCCDVSVSGLPGYYTPEYIYSVCSGRFPAKAAGRLCHTPKPDDQLSLEDHSEHQQLPPFTPIVAVDCYTGLAHSSPPLPSCR